MSYGEYEKSLCCLGYYVVFKVNQLTHHRTAVYNLFTFKVTEACCFQKLLNLHSDRRFYRNILISVAADGYVFIGYVFIARYLAVDIVNGFRFEACDEMVYCTGDGVKLRRKPGMDGEVIGYMFLGKKVQRIGRNSKWSRILRDGKRIYAAAEYLSPYPPETEAPSGEEAIPAEEAEAASGETEASKSASAGEERNEDQ